MSVPDAIHDAFDEFEDRSYDYSIGKGSADDALAARDNLFKAIAAHTFSDEERAAIRALATKEVTKRYLSDLHNREHTADEWAAAWDARWDAHEATLDLSTDVLKRLAGEGK